MDPKFFRVLSKLNLKKVPTEKSFWRNEPWTQNPTRKRAQGRAWKRKEQSQGFVVTQITKGSGWLWPAQLIAGADLKMRKNTNTSGWGWGKANPRALAEDSQHWSCFSAPNPRIFPIWAVFCSSGLVFIDFWVSGRRQVWKGLKRWSRSLDVLG